jgi:hypothetical protein
MAGIGGVACRFVEGEAPLKKLQLSIWQRPGIFGYGVQILGSGDSQFQFVGRQVSASRSTVMAWGAAIQNLQGSIVTIVNDSGAVYSNCLVAHVSPPHITAIRSAEGSWFGEIAVTGIVV